MSITRGRQQHEEIANFLRDRISDGTYAIGDPIPSEAELSAEFDSSRGPVRQAISALRSEGLVSSGRGRRSIVLDNVMPESFTQSISATRWITSHGVAHRYDTPWVTRHQASEKVAENLKLAPGDPVVSVQRVHYFNEHPIIIEKSIFPMRVGQHVLNFDFKGGSLHDYLADKGIDFHINKRHISAISASAEEAEVLQVAEGSALTHITMRVFDASGTPQEYTESNVDGDSLDIGTTILSSDFSPLWFKLKA